MTTQEASSAELRIFSPPFSQDPYHEGYEDQDAAYAQNHEDRIAAGLSLRNNNEIYPVRSVQVTPTPSDMLPSFMSLIPLYKIHRNNSYSFKYQPTRQPKTQPYHIIGIKQKLYKDLDFYVVQYKMVFNLDRQFVRNTCYRRSSFEWQ